MPRNAAGVYTLPPTNPVVPYTTIATSWANPTMSDIATELTNSLDRNGRGGMLAPFKIFDGTISAPGLAFLNEPGLGIWRSGTGTMQISVDSATEITVQAGEVYIPNLVAGPGGTGFLPLTGGTLTGPLGISAGHKSGVSGPFVLSTNDASNKMELVFTQNTNANYSIQSVEQGTSVRPLVLNPSGGGVGIGITPVPSARLQINTSSGNNLTFQDYSGVTAICSNDDNFSAWELLYLNPSGSVSICKDGGTVGIGNDPTAHKLSVGGNTYLGGALEVLGETLIGGIVRGKCFQPSLHIADINGTYAASWNTAQSQRLNLTGPTTVTLTGDVPDGSIIRLAFSNTQFGLTISGIQWPNGITPDFTTGPVKAALVVIQHIGATAWAGNYVAY